MQLQIWDSFQWWLLLLIAKYCKALGQRKKIQNNPKETQIKYKRANTLFYW